MIREWVPQQILDDAGLSLHHQFRGGAPFPHVVIPRFLFPDRANVLAQDLAAQQFEYKEADLFTFYQTHDLVNVRGGALKELYSMLASEDFAQFMTQLTGIGLKAGAINVSGTLYESTHYLLCHDDQVSNRKVAYLLYLGDDFTLADGGSFELYDTHTDGQPGELIKAIPPTFGTLLVFEVSKKSFHAVSEVLSKTKQRYAIGGWLA